jgi:hypothetical protein
MSKRPKLSRQIHFPDRFLVELAYFRRVLLYLDLSLSDLKEERFRVDGSLGWKDPGFLDFACGLPLRNH